MKRIWIVTNPGSGSTSPERCAMVERAVGKRGALVVGRTDFPSETLPSAAMLDAAGIDTLVLFGGDGTINAALCALADWPGKVLILPGGTMNLLARALHGTRHAEAIVATIDGAERLDALPFVEAGPHRAFVGLIIGPAAHWVRAREAVRARRWDRMIAAARNAWRRTFARGVALDSLDHLAGRYQAVLVRPADDGLLVSAVDARAWSAIVGLGWQWLTGDWMTARAVSNQHARTFAIAGRRPVLALFDGEPVLLDPGVTVSGGRTAPRFIATTP